MNAATADYCVMVVFGLLLGSILKLYASIVDLDRAPDRPEQAEKRPWRERLANAFDREKSRAENQALLKSMPRSGWIAMVFLYGLVLMLVLVVKISPVTMRWWPFLGSVLGAYMTADFLFRRTAARSRREVGADTTAPGRVL
jgi:hypothetical protein